MLHLVHLQTPLVALTQAFLLHWVLYSKPMNSLHHLMGGMRLDPWV